MKTLDQIKLMNENNFEKNEMNKTFGGQGGSPCTLDTITVYPDKPCENDGDDSYAGECGVAQMNQLYY